jgi:uncharacterized protein (TIGR02996 family)
MPSDRDALLAAICADPDDDTPRLVFADWLDENGESARAEFIRAQVEFARLTDDGSDSQAVYEFLRDRDWVTRPAAKWDKIDAGIARRIALASRIEKLRKKHGKAWSANLPKKCGLKWGGFHRGFPGRAEVADAGLLAGSAARVTAVAPAVTVELGARLRRDEFARMQYYAGLLPWIRGVEVTFEDNLMALAPRDTPARCRSLRISGGRISEYLVETFARSEFWSELHTLDLGGALLDPDAAKALFAVESLRKLTRLSLSGDGWAADHLQALADIKFTNLTHLHLVGCDLDDDAAEVLANAPSLRKLRYLDVGENNIRGRGATALLASPHLRNVAFLGLEENPIRGLDAKALESAPAGGLRLFHAHGCRLTVKDVAALARSPRVRDLWYLDLDENGLPSGAVREIVRGFGDRCPPVVWLTYNRIDAAGAELLADWPAAQALRVLQLYFNPIDDAGTLALLNSPHLKNLDGFGVSGVSAAVAKQVRKRFKKHGIVYDIRRGK